MPIILGKKCPRCKTANFSSVSRKSWLCSTPGVQHLSCSDCGQDFYFFIGCSILHDKRTSKRLQPPNTLLVRFREKEQKFAQIEDISTEGIGFSYNLDQQKFVRDRFSIDLYNCKQGTSLEDLPVQVVSTKVSVEQISGQPTTILRNGAYFADLSRTQKKLLKHFIEESGRQSAQDIPQKKYGMDKAGSRSSK